jgi:hypothetical protein
MTPQLESLMQQAIQLDRDERLELITHLANSLHSSESHDYSAPNCQDRSTSKSSRETTKTKNQKEF